MHVDIETGEIVAKGDDAPRRGSAKVVQADAICSAKGKIKVRDKLDPESSLIADLKAKSDGEVRAQQIERLARISGSRDPVRVHSPYRWSAKEGKIIRTASTPIKGLRALKAATAGVGVVGTALGAQGIYAAVTDQNDEVHLAKIGDAVGRVEGWLRSRMTAEARLARMDAIDAIKTYLDTKTAGQWDIATSLGAYWAYLKVE